MSVTAPPDIPLASDGDGLGGLAGRRQSDYSAPMSTVTEIKRAVSKLPPRKKLALARWLQNHMDDRLNDNELMTVAAEGARALDRREAECAKRQAR